MFLPVAGVIALGIVFSRYNYQPISYIGIYNDSDIDNNLQVTYNASTYARYFVPNTYAEVDEFFNIDPEFAVKTKAADGDGSFGIQAYSKYVRSVRDLNNTVDIVLYVKVEKSTHTFPSSTPCLQNWQDLPQNIVGTHYVKSVKYGGYAIGYIRFKPRQDRYLADIKSAVNKYFGKSGNLMDLKPETFDQFEKEIEFKYLIGTSSFGKSSLDPMDLAFTLKAIWQEAIKFLKSEEESNGRDTPVAMELADLSTINNKYTEFKKNPDLNAVLIEANSKFDDLRVAYNRYYETTFNQMIYNSFTTEQKEMFNKQWEEMQKPYFTLLTAVRKLDVTGNATQLDQAIAMYGSKTDTDKYNKEFDELMDKIRSKAHL